MRKPEMLNRWFAVSSLLMSLSIVWMVWVDYERPWRRLQDRYFISKAAFAHLDYLDTTRQERVQEIEDGRRRLKDAEDYVAQTGGARRERLQAERTQVSLKFSSADGEWSRKNQVLHVTKNTYEVVLAQHGADHPATEESHRQLRDEEETVETLRMEKELWEDELARLSKELQALEAPVEAARKKLRELETVAQEALAKDQSFRGVLSDTGLLGGLPMVKWVVNFPLGDFTAPKNTPSRHQVNQLVLPNIRQRLNYLESYTTDRCTTCHVAIDDPQFAMDRLARKLERSLAGINEALQRLGRQPLDLPPTPEPAVPGRKLEPGQVTEHWEELTAEQREQYFQMLLERVNRYLRLTGRKTIDLRQPLLAHPDLDLYVSVDSPHPMAQMGCTVCHEGNPQETDFVLAGHAPATHKVRDEWEEEYYTRVLGIPNITFETVEHYWDRPMRLPQYTEAGCAKCHTEVTDITRFNGERKGTRINLGRYLFENVGCINCHNDEGIRNAPRVGPDLTHVGAKLTPEFVQQWVFFPQKFRPSTRMPHFFLQENSRPESANKFDPDPVLRTEAEVASVSAYLFAVSRPWKPIAKPQDVVGDVERGRKLFREVGCLACHANVAEFGEQWIPKDIAQRSGLDPETARHKYLGMTQEDRVRYAMEHFVSERDTFLKPDQTRFDPDRPYQPPILTRFAPELSGVGSKVRSDWLYSWLIEPAHYAPETKMPRLRLTPTEAVDVTAYLMSLKNSEFRQAVFELNRERREQADKLVLSLLSAQRSERRSQAIMSDEGNELSDMLVSLLAPSFGREAASDLVRPMSVADKRLLYLGNKTISHYGCYACHKIAGFENATPPGTNLTTWAEKPVSQLDFAFYDDAFHGMREEHADVFRYIFPQNASQLNYWSPLDDQAREEVTHTHTAFAKHKMLNPRIWDREKIKKPYDKLKMPNFYFTEAEAEALTTYLLSRLPPRVNDVLQVPYDQDTSGPIARGRNLTRDLNCIACHQIEDNSPTIQQYFRRRLGTRLEFDSINAPPALAGEGAKVQHNWLHRFVQQVEPLRPWLQVRMPSFTLTGEQATTLVEYFAALSQRESQDLEQAKARIDEYTQSHAQGGGQAVQDAAEGVAEWYGVEALDEVTGELQRWALERKLLRPAELNPLLASRETLREAHKRLLDRVEFLQKLNDVAYPFVEPPRPLASADYFEQGRRFFNDMGCLKCHVLGDMLPGPAKNTDEFVDRYRLDGVRGEADEATAIINGRPYPVGAVIDGNKLIRAENVYYETGDVETKAIFEGVNASGQTENILLQAPSAPNLSLTYQRLRRSWVYDWMLEPQWMQPGTKMPQNFPGGKSPFLGDAAYPGTSTDHINLLVDFLYQAGATSTRAPIPKIAVSAGPEEFEESGKTEEEFEE